MSREKYYDYLKNFGFGELTKIQLPGEASGLLSNPKKWSDIKAANISFGQGISVTSIQLAKALSAIANGGVIVEPYIVKSITDPNNKVSFIKKNPAKKRVLSFATSKEMKRLLRTVVEDGGGFKAKIEGVSVAGKTGTGQFAIKGGYDKKRFIVSFIGFAPTDNPQLVSVITIDYPKGERAYGGRWAAPVFKETIEKIMIDENRINEVVSLRDVPSFIGKAKRDVIRIAEENNLKIKINGNGYVKEQTPNPGNKYKSNQEIKVFLEPGI